VRDLPLGGRPVLIRLAMRRFVCMNVACKKVTFAGQADGLTARYQRWSVPLAGLLSQIALELAGRAGTRLAGALGIAVHPARSRSPTAGICGTTWPSTPPRPLPATGPASSKSPQLPNTHNHHRNPQRPLLRLRRPNPGWNRGCVTSTLPSRPWPPAAWACAIARELGVDRKTARRFAHAATGDEAVARAISRPTVLDRYQPHLHRRWTEGCHDTAVLHAEITALGYRGSLRTVYRYLQPLRAGTDPAALIPSALKIGEVTSWLLRRAEDLSPRQQQLLADVRGHCSQLDRLAEHVTGFAKMMTKRTGQQNLAGWLERVEADDQPELHTFAAGIRHDLAAVTAGLSLPYSSGATEGNVNRLKAIKRQMYGRASLDLLRKRVIHHPP
jgi:transposase